LNEPEIISLFDGMGILSPVELASRYETYAEQYILSIEVEAKLVISIAKTMIYPAATRYLTDLATTVAGLKEIGVDFDAENAQTVATLTKSMMDSVSKLALSLSSHDFDSTEAHMQYLVKTVRPLMDEVRKYADGLEAEVADDLWPLPTYQEMLFIK
jgi:glutamine synthetase